MVVECTKLGDRKMTPIIAPLNNKGKYNWEAMTPTMEASNL